MGKAVEDVDTAAASCVGESPDCTTAVKTLSDAVKNLDDPAKKLASECAGKKKSAMDCAYEGLQFAAHVATVAKDAHLVSDVCRKKIDTTTGLPIENAKGKGQTKGKGKATTKGKGKTTTKGK